MGNATWPFWVQHRRLLAWVMGMVLATAGALVVADHGSVGAAESGPVVMVVGNPSAPTAGDAAVEQRLEGLGYTVTVVDDSGVTASAAAGASFVLITSSVSSSAVGSTFHDVAQPVWVAKPWGLDDMGLTGAVPNTDYGTVSASGATIIGETHPLAAGYSGTVQVTPSNKTMSFGIPGPEATIVTTAASQPSTFVHSEGSMLADGSAAAGCRIHLSVFRAAPGSFTEDGWALFDAAANYAAGGCSTVGADDPPTVDLTEPAAASLVSGTVTIRATATDDVGVVRVDFLVDGISLGVDTDDSDGWSMDWDTGTQTDGATLVTAIATDTADQAASVSVVVTVDNLGLTGNKVVLISVDGLRPDVVGALGQSELPDFYRLANEGLSTHNARTMFDSTRTLPNHTSMVTAVPVLGPDGHGVTFNEDDGLTVHDAAGRYVPSVFDVAHDGGLSTALLAGKPKFDFLDRSWDAAHGGPDVVGVDNGPDKIDHYERGAGGSITDSWVSLMSGTPFDLSVIHYAAPDGAGHEFGWASPEYEQALRDVDVWLGQVLDAIESDPILDGITTLVLTADHGGNGTSHSDLTLPIIYTIPYYVWGAGVTADADLYALDPTSRLDPGTGRPDHGVVPQPVRNADAANLLLAILGLGPVPGSTINMLQDLGVSGEVEPPALVLMVAGNAATLSSGDAAVYDRLVMLGFDVRLVDDDAVEAADAVGASYVFLASSIKSSIVGDTFATSSVPVWVAKPWSLDDMGLTGTVAGVDYGKVRSATVDVVDGSHPMAAGFAGNVMLTPTVRSLSFGQPVSTADVAATADGLPTTFAYDAGATLADGSTAAGCRLHAPAFTTSVLAWTDEAWGLFDAAAAFAAAGCA